MAFTRRAPRRSESSLSLSWQNELKKECYWQNELSFTNLKSKLQLVQNYDEWRSIKNSFRYKNVTSDKVIAWLKHQQGQFRKSYLHYLLISGYSRECNVSFFNLEIAPKDVQDIILCYTNLCFIKLYTKSSQTAPELRTFDCNITINNLTAILKKDNGYKDCSDLRLWTRYDAIKFIYSVQKYGDYHETFTRSYHDEEGLEGDRERARWVQIPRSYGKYMTLTDIDDKLKHHQVLEFGVDKMRKIFKTEPASISGAVLEFCVDKMKQIFGTDTDRGDATIKGIKWTFKADEDEHEEKKYDDDNDYNHFEWIQGLKIGDNIDVDIGGQWPWMNAYIFGRDFDTFYIHIPNAKTYRLHPNWEIKSIGIDNLRRLQPSYTRCKGNDNLLTPTNVYQECNLVDCEWMTAFNTASPFIHYPVLFD